MAWTFSPDLPLDTIDTEVIAVKTRGVELGLAKKTVNNLLAILGNILNVARRGELIAMR